MSPQFAKIESRSVPGLVFCLGLLAAVTLVRLIGLRLSIVDLYVDESQYWTWSRELAAGYFSKPPLLAFVIAGAQAVCGGAEACLRMPAPLFYFGTCALIYLIADELYGRAVAFWAALLMCFTPGLAFSSRIISTDVPLLFFWSLALLAWVKLLRGFDWRWSLVLGLSLGFGALAKYAMIYFLLGMGLAAALDRDARRILLSPAPLIAIAIIAAMLAPNIIWNVENGFSTLQHTGENIKGGGAAFNPLKGFEFLASQAGIVGPVIFVTLVILLIRFHQSDVKADRLMIAFALPVLLLVTATAFTTRAHPNWAATAMISATIAAAAYLVRRNAGLWIGASLLLGIVAQIGLLAGDAFADRVTIRGFAKGDLYQRTMGWRGLGQEAQRMAERSGAAAIAAETREDISALAYYTRTSARPVLAWALGERPGNHFELKRPLTAQAASPIIFITRCARPARLAAGFSSVESLGQFDIASGPTTNRRYFAFRLAGARQPLPPLGPCS